MVWAETPGALTVAQTRGCASLTSTVTSTSPLSTSGVNRTPVTYIGPSDDFGTGSIHTVCQMPVTGVYQMPPGLLTCLPRGWAAASVGSHTRTTSSFGPSFSASVTSNENGSDMPRCVPSSFPVTNTVDSQSTAWKWSSTRCATAFHAAGASIVRRYHRCWSFDTRWPTPDKADSTQNGTRTLPSHFSGLAAARAVMA